MIAKFVIVLIKITTLYFVKPLFYKIFLDKPWSPLFTQDSSLNEWFFRWKLDRYTVLEGMILGYLVALARKSSLLNDGASDRLVPSNRTMVAVGAGAAAIIGYLAFAISCSHKVSCNNVHTYVVLFPILGYILLRNLFGVVRQRFSVLFAWAGRISLELFIVQFHIWLAADTYGVLVFFPGYPVLNVTTTSVIYVCVAHEVHVITGVLAEHLVPKDGKRLGFAVLVFSGILMLLYFSSKWR